MRTDIDQAAARLAARQYGVFGQHQILAYGGNKDLIYRRIRTGRWDRLSGRVLALAGAQDGFKPQLMAAAIHTPDAVVSHTAAAKLGDLPHLAYVTEEITGAYDSGRRNPFARTHRSIDLAPEDIVSMGPLPVTSVERTVADLLTVFSRQRVEHIVDDLLNSRRTTLEALAAMHGRYARGGRPTTVAMREIIAERGPGWIAPGSRLESMALEMFDEAGLPPPDHQVPLPGWGDEPGLVDLAWVPQRVIVELDGRRWHGRDQAYQRDRERDHAALLAGWLPLRFTWFHLTQRRDYTINTARSALRARS